MSTIITLFVGLFGGFASIALWEGIIKPRRDRKAIAVILAVEVERVLQVLINFRVNLTNDPHAAHVSLVAYNTMFQLVARELPVLGADVCEDVVDFYQSLAHVDQGLATAFSLLEAKRAEPQRSAQLDAERKAFLGEMRTGTAPVVDRGRALLVRLNEIAGRKGWERQERLQRSSLELRERVKAFAEKRDGV